MPSSVVKSGRSGSISAAPGITASSPASDMRFECMSMSWNPPMQPTNRAGSEAPPHRLRVSESPARRRSSSASALLQQLPDEDCMRLNPSFLGIAFSSLLAVDLWLSKRLGVCACEASSWGSIRPLMKLIEVSGHWIPWLTGVVYCLHKSDSIAGQEVMLNLLLALVLDVILVWVVKIVVRRRRSIPSRSDVFFSLSAACYTFPSGHATRAAMCARFLLAHLVLATPLRMLVPLWAVLVGASRVLLGRHNVTDVLFGFAMGYCQYGLVERLWVSSVSLQDMVEKLASLSQ